MKPRPRYADVHARFTWEPSLRALGWTADGPVNLGETIVDRHAASGRVALRWFGKAGTSRNHTFAELARLSSQFAGFLARRGVGKGDRVAGFMPRSPGDAGGHARDVEARRRLRADLHRVRRRCHRVSHARQRSEGALHAMGVSRPHPGASRLHDARDGGRSRRGRSGRRRLLVGGERRGRGGTLAPCRRDDPAVLLYTSGSTGPPKGVAIATNFVLSIHPYMIWGVDLAADDVFWPTGDPGWGYGLICYMVALAMGVPVVCQEAAPSPELTLARLRDLGVTNLATTPTLLRGIMALGEEAVRATPVRLRCASSCGEPLNAEVVTFFQRVWGVTVMDQYGSSEFGLPIANCNAIEMEVRPGSMGLPLPGCRMAVVDDDGREVADGIVGQIAHDGRARRLLLARLLARRRADARSVPRRRG